MEIDQKKIEAAIVEQAVQNMIGDNELYNRVKRGLDERIDKMFAERVSALLDETIKTIVRDGFEREYCKADGFGRLSGEPTTIAKELEQLVSGYWQQTVDRQGKKTDSSYGTTSRAEWMMLQICADEFSKEMKQHTLNVAGALKDHFREVLHDHIAIMLSDVFKVKSQGDQKLAAAKKSTGSAIIHSAAKPIGAQ